MYGTERVAQPLRAVCLGLCLGLELLTPFGAAHGDEVRVAVAANFAGTMDELVDRFEAGSEHEVLVSIGSTGSHYAQIRNGAPFDAFFAADAERPARLEKEGAVVPGSRYTYAVGRLVLWSPRAGLVDSRGRVLEAGDFRHLAIANPALAPYGAAAREVLRTRGVWDALQGRLVRGHNVGQAYAYVRSGNAELGFVAYSQIRQPGRSPTGSYWVVPESMHRAIEQQAVLLDDTPGARAFFEFVQSPSAREVIRSYGYGA